MDTKSSVIKTINYLSTDKQLKVNFKSGQTYTYFNVPKNLYERFTKAKSKGRFFSQNIQKRFPYRQGKSNKMVIPVKGYTYKANGRKITVPAHTRVVQL